VKIERYASYKDSGVDWLGDVPDGWELARIKEIATVRGRVGWKALKADEYVDQGYIFLATPNIKNKEINFKNVNFITHERYIESPEIMLREGDILLTKDGSTLGTINIVRFLPSKATVNSSIAVIRVNKEFYNKYIFYQILSDSIQNKINLKKSGMGVPHLFQRDINNFFILLPFIQEQKTIADYLDTKINQIDQEINLLTQKAEQYGKLKQSLINETVTQGLDKSVAMKPSGVEWIGEIPEHWEVKRIKEISTINKSSLSEKTQLDYEFEYIDIGSVTYGIKGYSTERMTFKDSPSRAKRIVEKGDTIISTVRTYLKAIASISENVQDLIVSTGFAVISPKWQLNEKYCSYVLTSEFIIDEINAKSKGVSYPAITATEIGGLLFLMPPIEEQNIISIYLDEKTNQIDTITQTINNKISKLKELRKTLINDVVTGKIKVV